ncbi:unnamed protein product, partial [Scytosiphon promiscuus]
MSSATSESYCNHLRGQLKEWERAFRSRNGRFPKQADFDALESDGSARGRLLHGSYLALNRATGDSFTKSLATRESTQSMVIIGGPRQSVAERKNAETLRNAQRHRHGASSSSSSSSSNRNTNDSDSKNTHGGASDGTSAKGGAPISRHLDIMDRLRAKVQERPGSSLNSLLAVGKAGQKRPKVNALLAAGDGHRRGGGGGKGDIARENKERPDGALSGAAGVSVSRRARAMGMSSAAAKIPAEAKAPTKADASAPSTRDRRKSRGEDTPRARESSRAVGVVGGDGDGKGKGGASGGGGDRHAEESYASGGGERGHGSGRKEATGPPHHSFVDEKAPGPGDGTPPRDTAGRRSSGTTDPYGREPQQEQNERETRPAGSERDLTPERRATRRAGGPARGGGGGGGNRGAVPGAISNTLSSFRTEVGRRVANNARSLSGGRSSSSSSAAAAARTAGGSGAAMVFSPSDGQASAKGSAGLGRSTRSSAAAATAAGGGPAAGTVVDEAGLAMAMMDILQPSEAEPSPLSAPAASAASVEEGGEVGGGQDHAIRPAAMRAGNSGRGNHAGAAASKLLLATNIVNTVGGASGGGGTGGRTGLSLFCPPSSSSSSSSGSRALRTPARVATKVGPTSASATEAEESTTAITGAICGPGLVASSASASSSSTRRTEAGGGGGGGGGVEGDWHLRASRAVGRVR